MGERTSWSDLVYIEHLAGELKGLEGDGHERAWEVFTDMACSQAESNASELIDLRAQVKALEAEVGTLKGQLRSVGSKVDSCDKCGGDINLHDVTWWQKTKDGDVCDLCFKRVDA